MNVDRSRGYESLDKLQLLAPSYNTRLGSYSGALRENGLYYAVYGATGAEAIALADALKQDVSQ